MRRRGRLTAPLTGPTEHARTTSVEPEKGPRGTFLVSGTGRTWRDHGRSPIIRPMHCSSIGGAGAVPRLWFDRGTLLLDALDGEQVRALFGRDAWAWDGRVGAWRSDAIHYAAVRRALRERFGRGWQDEVPGPPPVRWPKVDLPPLRPEQQEALAAWRAGCWIRCVRRSGGRGMSTVRSVSKKPGAVQYLQPNENCKSLSLAGLSRKTRTRKDSRKRPRSNPSFGAKPVSCPRLRRPSRRLLAQGYVPASYTYGYSRCRARSSRNPASGSAHVAARAAGSSASGQARWTARFASRVSTASARNSPV